MKVYISCDMEGVSGIVDWRQVTFSDPASAQGRRLATLDLNAVVEGALSGGATEVVAWDGHGNFPGSLDPEILHPRCRLVMNGGDGGMVGFDASYAALLFCGLHGMAGASGGVLAHSFTRQIESFAVNGIAMGEIGLTMLVAGAFGVPAVFLAGDAAAVREAQALVPGLEGVAVKEGLSPRGVLVRSPATARQEISAGTARAVTKARQVAPYTLPAPYRMTTRWRTRADALRDAGRPGAVLVDPFTVEVVVNDLRTFSG